MSLGKCWEKTTRASFNPSKVRRRFLASALLLGAGAGAFAIVTDFTLVGVLHEPAAVHADQFDLLGLVQGGQEEEAFEAAFEKGDELFDTPFNALDGVGANVGLGQRFTRVPRADLTGPGEWAKHFPERATGPNAESCSACHNTPFDDGGGPASANVHRDPLHSGSLGSMIQRNTPHLFGAGGIQRLAEEMTAKLHQIRDQAAAQACASGTPKTKVLLTKDVNFGTITAIPAGNPCTVTFDTSNVQGVAADLVVRPFQWKGSVPSLRDFNRGASHNELGMQAVEIVGDGVDGDADGVADEMTVGDQTALAVYLAAQPRPTRKIELSSLGLIPPLSSQEIEAINHGRDVFANLGCTSCHRPSLNVNDPVFREPSANPNFRDATFPAGQDPVAMGLDPAFPVSFDLTGDQPDNRILGSGGNLLFHLGAFQTDEEGDAIVRLFGDLKRHDMGPGLAEPIDEVGSGSSVFLTENLWGVGSTAPYLHDGRATTLTEAILEHGGEAQASRNAFLNASLGSKKDLIAFLENLVLFKLEEEEE
jgi:di-heme oxidoreductase (putative peroxidase)